MTELVTCRWFDRAEHARRRTFTPPPDRGAARRAMVAMMKMTKTAIEHGDAWFARRYVAGRKALTTLTTASVARVPAIGDAFAGRAGPRSDVSATAGSIDEPIFMGILRADSDQHHCIAIPLKSLKNLMNARSCQRHFRGICFLAEPGRNFRRPSAFPLHVTKAGDCHGTT